ncbi:hypothetical protein FXO38_29877 [Capsicum annuum]|nr:hypothetical protein FXO38_29877 [Capsicum annuum]
MIRAKVLMISWRFGDKPWSKGFRLSRTKTEYLECKFSDEAIGRGGSEVGLPVWPAMLYEAECWSVKNSHIQKLKVAEMRMLHWMCGFARVDRVRNEIIREKVGVVSVEDKMREVRLRWYGLVMRRGIDVPVRRCGGLALDSFKRGRGRPKKYWREVIKCDMEQLQLTEDMTLDRKACLSSKALSALPCLMCASVLSSRLYYIHFLANERLLKRRSQVQALKPTSGLFDQIIHSTENVDIIGLFQHLYPKVMVGLPLLRGINPASCFPRTAIGYEATCYSHIWSEVLLILVHSLT